MTLNKRVFKKLKRAQNLLGESDLEKAIENVLDQFLDRKDPVRKAERSKSQTKQPVKPDTLGGGTKQPVRRVTFGRANITAHQRHEVHARDQGRCTYVDALGRRCENERWLHLHHIKSISVGGSNAPENMRTLCSAHLDLVHQLSFEMRSPQAAYLPA